MKAMGNWKNAFKLPEHAEPTDEEKTFLGAVLNHQEIEKFVKLLENPKAVNVFHRPA